MVPDFDRRCAVITSMIREAADWKHNYFGAAYTTRLVQAAKRLREAASEIDKLVADDGKP